MTGVCNRFYINKLCLINIFHRANNAKLQRAKKLRFSGKKFYFFTPQESSVDQALVSVNLNYDNSWKRQIYETLPHKNFWFLTASQPKLQLTLFLHPCLWRKSACKRCPSNNNCNNMIKMIKTVAQDILFSCKNIMHFLQKALNCAGRETHKCCVLLSHAPTNELNPDWTQLDLVCLQDLLLLTSAVWLLRLKPCAYSLQLWLLWVAFARLSRFCFEKCKNFRLHWLTGSLTTHMHV